MVAQPARGPPAWQHNPPVGVSCPSASSLMKVFNRTGPSTHSWGWPPVGLCATHHHALARPFGRLSAHLAGHGSTRPPVCEDVWADNAKSLAELEASSTHQAGPLTVGAHLAGEVRVWQSMLTALRQRLLRHALGSGFQVFILVLLEGGRALRSLPVLKELSPSLRAFKAHLDPAPSASPTPPLGSPSFLHSPGGLAGRHPRLLMPQHILGPAPHALGAAPLVFSQAPRSPGAAPCVFGALPTNCTHQPPAGVFGPAPFGAQCCTLQARCCSPCAWPCTPLLLSAAPPVLGAAPHMPGAAPPVLGAAPHVPGAAPLGHLHPCRWGLATGGGQPCPRSTQMPGSLPSFGGVGGRAPGPRGSPQLRPGAPASVSPADSPAWGRWGTGMG